MSRRGSHNSSSSLRGRPGSISVGGHGARAAGSPATGSAFGRVAASAGGERSGSPASAGAGGSGSIKAASLQRQVGPRMPMPPDPSRRIVDFHSADDKCPQCKTDRYLNAKLRILVSPCYHKMCESCLDRIFSLGPAPCPECGHVCRKYEFGVQTFQDLRVEREVDIRQRVGKLFNKREQDFDSLKAYNDYLEEVETLLFNLLNDVDVPKTEARIEAYRASNKASIQANSRNTVAEGEAQRAREEAIRAARAARATRRRARDERDRREREQDEHDLVEALAGRGEVDEQTMLRRKKENERKRTLRMEREEREEEEQARRNELMMGAAAAASSTTATNGGATAAKAEDGWPAPFSIDMLLDFEGPLASYDDGRASLFDLRSAPVALGGASTAATTGGYEDPWITAMPDKEDVVRLRAAGYDWSQTWERDIRSACMGLGVAPIEG